MAFTIEERQVLGIHGLLPAAVKTQDEQLELCRLNLERYTDDLSKYIYLIGLLVHILMKCGNRTASDRRSAYYGSPGLRLNQIPPPPPLDHPSLLILT